MTARWIASTTHCICNVARNSNAKPVPPLVSLIVRASKAPKKGAQIDPHGFDAGKLIKGKKRHILVDMQGLLLHGIVTSACVQDRDGGILLLSTLFGMFPFLKKLFADSAYEGPIFHTALASILPCLKRKSSNVPTGSRALSFCPNAGLLNAPSVGSTAAADSPRIGKTSIATPLLS